MILDGELWAGRGSFENVQGLLQKKQTDVEWKSTVFKGVSLLVYV
jgi:hypothetical protein